MHVKWQPSPGEEVWWSPAYQSQGLQKPARRVVFENITHTGLARIKLGRGRYRAVTPDTLRPV